eukprot:COSAG02_NODE_763_length_17431_cov_18.031502_12_plen_102_part_00
MDTFFGHALINVSNSLGPHCTHLHRSVWFQSDRTSTANDRVDVIRSNDHMVINADIGGGLNHGIEIQNGPHKGRLVLALRFDTACAHSPDYMRAYALFSDE